MNLTGNRELEPDGTEPVELVSQTEPWGPMGGAHGPQGVNRKNCCARLKRAQQFLLQYP